MNDEALIKFCFDIFDIDKGDHLRLENPFKYTISNDFSKQRVINSAFDVPNGFVKESSNEYQIWANLFFMDIFYYDLGKIE